jgi:SNF2 family DNA or RNA helicase
MAILHGSWLADGGLWIWGEVWRSTAAIAATEAVFSHPFALSNRQLRDFLTQQTRVTSDLLTPEPSSETLRVMALPTLVTTINDQPSGLTVLPLHSRSPLPEQLETVYLYPWAVTGICLPSRSVLAFLNVLPLNTVSVEESILGDDLRFWTHVARWSLDLLSRAKVLPELESLPDGAIATHWQPLLDSAIDEHRLRNFSQQMPLSCRTYASSSESSVSEPGLSVELPREPQELLRGFLKSVLDAQVRSVIGKSSRPGVLAKPPTPELPAYPVQQWLTALGTPLPTFQLAPGAAHQLLRALETWTTPVQAYLSQQLQFRACFQLHVPEMGDLADGKGSRRSPASNPTDWILEYCLQATDDPELRVSAATIWKNPVDRLVYQGRTIESPQETLLMGLGLASRIYPVLELSLQTQRPKFSVLNSLQAYDFIKTIAWRLQDSGFGIILPGNFISGEGWASRLGLSIKAENFLPQGSQRLGLNSLLNFQWELSIGGHHLTKAEFERLVAQNTPLVQVEGEWVELRPQDVRAAQAFFASRKDQLALSLEDALHISTGDTQTIEKLPVVDFEASGSLQELITALTGNRQIEAIAPPRSFRGELRPYQARGVGWLTFLERWGLGACLADDMGLGKSVETIAFLLNLQEQQDLEQPILLVCPTSVLGNWEREVRKFGPSLKALVHHGDKRAKGKAFQRTIQGKHLVITSYALVHRDAKELESITWRGVILDEAQNIKNPDAKQSQTVRQLSASFRIALTGTPVENRLSELWSILDFLNPGYLGTRPFFQRRFATPIERFGDTTSLQTLRSLVQPFILRRLKTDREIIQDLPDKQEMTVFCGLTAEQASLYQHLVEKSLQDIESAEGIQRRGMILALLVKLKQVCNHPAQFLQEKQLGAVGRSGKLLRLEEMLEEVLAEGDRALIFTQFAEWGKLLKVHLESHLGHETLFLYGGTSKKHREEMIDRFQHDPQAPYLFILSLKAGGTGLNLTRANHVFHCDRWWNPAVENQATDRVFRIGQTRNVQVHKFVCSGTLEEKIHDLIESKKALAEQVVGAGEDWLTELDTNQLRNLLLLDRTAVIDSED